MSNRISYVLLLLILAGGFACKTTQSTQRGSSVKAAGELDEATRRKVEVVYVEACTQMMRGDYQASMELFREVLNSDPSNHAAMYNIAKLAVEQRNFNEAIDFGKSALKLDPENYWYYQILATAYQAKGDFANAVAVQERITSQFPERLEERIKLASLYQREERFEDALKQLQYIEDRVGPNEETLLEKLRIYVQHDQPEMAVQATQQLILIDPTNLRYRELEFETLQSLGRDEEAIDVLKQMLEQDSGNSYALFNLADIYKTRNELDKSDEYLFRAFENPEINPQEKVRIVEGLMVYAERQPEVLPRIRTLTSILGKVHPGNADVFSLKGDLFFIEKETDSAYVYYRKAVEIDGAREKVWLGLLFSAFQKQDNKLLQKNAEEALEYYPNQEEFLFFYGISSTQLGDQAEAIYALEKLKKVGTDNLEMLSQAYSQLASIYNDQKQYPKSDENFELALELNPDDDVVLNNYAYFLSLRKEKLEKAKMLIEKALELQPEQASYLDTYGWVLYQMGDYEGAEKQIKKAIESGGSAEVHEHYGDVLYKLGKKDQALEAWNKAIELGAAGLNINDKTKEP